MSNTPVNISDKEWSQKLFDGLCDAPECEECGLGADCSLNGQLLCAGHATAVFFDLLSEIVDPAEICFDVKFDVRADDDMELEGFTANWFYYGKQSAEVTLLDLANRRKENELIEARGLPDAERLSVCCGAKQIGDSDLCPDCREHTEFVTEGEL